MALQTKAAHRKDLTTGIGEMQHRHFATVATIIRELPAFYDTCRTDLAENFANRLTDTNPNFDRDRFLRACQPV